MTHLPLCFVLMPFGTKPDATGGADIDFDRVYEDAIAKGVSDAGMQPVRADEERVGGIIHKPMFERLILCDFAVADLTTGNANVFYELGVRHTARPHTTVTIFAGGQRIPFDVDYLRAIPYDLGPHHRFGAAEAATLRTTVAARLSEVRRLAADTSATDSPLFQLLTEWHPDIPDLHTDVFQERVQFGESVKRRLAGLRARSRDEPDAAVAELRTLQRELAPLDAVEVGVLFDVLHTCRYLGDWDAVIDFVTQLPSGIRDQVPVSEQLAFAHNRRAERDDDPRDRDRALELLDRAERRQGPTSESCGLRGRVHKGAWLARRRGRPLEAAAHLSQAIESYRAGFVADPRDPYPGVNLLTLLYVRGEAADLAEVARRLPVVEFAAVRRVDAQRPDYWTHASLLELAVLTDDGQAALRHAGSALATGPEPWQIATTAANLRLVATAAAGRGLSSPVVEEILRELEPAAVPTGG